MKYYGSFFAILFGGFPLYPVGMALLVTLMTSCIRTVIWLFYRSTNIFTVAALEANLIQSIVDRLTNGHSICIWRWRLALGLLLASSRSPPLWINKAMVFMRNLLYMLDFPRCPIDKNYLFVLGHSGACLIFIINYVNPTFVFFFVNQLYEISRAFSVVHNYIHCLVDCPLFVICLLYVCLFVCFLCLFFVCSFSIFSSVFFFCWLFRSFFL